MSKTVSNEIFLSNGHRLKVQTSTRQKVTGKESTFISINTDYFRISITQRISLNDLLPRNARITISTESETDNLASIETLALALKEAIKFAERLNKNVV